jgi:putative peptide zinc metalloprotease protein
MQQAPATTCATPRSPAELLLELPIVLRSDLQVTRQLHQGQPAYVVHDPVSFKTHRLTRENYHIYVRLNAARSVGENFETLVAQQHLKPDDQEFFCQYLMQLHQLGLIVLPVGNGAKLFEQHQKISQQKKYSRIHGIFFLQIPLAHPDGFLTRTAPRMKWLFSRGFALLWFVAGFAALCLVASRMAEFSRPFNGVLATGNLPFLWLTFVGLKIWHELGHGYACKLFGGAVPEMGMMLIIGTPAAYVDASAAWSFPERWKRLVVMCGGMYFESLVAIPAVFVWAFSANPIIASCAYQLVLMASLITVLFNANPLMKYDGYFIAAEMLQIRNLRGRADQQVKSLLNRVILGLRSKPAAQSTQESIILTAYGILAAIYRTMLVLGIAVMIAARFPLIGLAIAGFHLVTSLGGAFWKLAVYLVRSKETEPVRIRSLIVAAIVLVLFPLLTLFVPMPFGVVSYGVVSAETEHYVNAETAGRYAVRCASPGTRVAGDQKLLELSSPALISGYQTTKATLQEALLNWEVAHSRDLVRAAQLEPRITELKHQLLEAQQKVNQLTVVPPGAGILAWVYPESETGRHVEVGELVAVVVDGRPQLRTWLTEDQLGSVRLEPGAVVEFRIPGRSVSTYTARLKKIEPAAEASISSLSNALTFFAGGEIVINPKTGLPMVPLFQLDMDPVENDILKLSDHGMRVSIKLPGSGETIASWVIRRLSRFIQKTLLA